MGETEAVTLLRSIDASLKVLIKTFGAGMVPVAPTTGASKKVATDADLDGKYGDPVINAKDPRDWTGPSMKGRKFSECPAEYLDLVADRLDYFAEQAEKEGKLTSTGKPVAPFNRADAARARGWAWRIRQGTHVPAPVEEAGEIDI